jgi:hypothetical protein
MTDTGIITLAVGLVIVFGATTALASAATEAVARFLGLRGAFLLRGLYELLDGSQKSNDLGTTEDSYHALRRFIIRQRATNARSAANAEPDNGQLQEAAREAEAVLAEFTQLTDRSPAAAANPGSAVPSATSALLGSPILRSRGMAAQNMTLQPPSEPGRLPELTVGSGRQLRPQCRSLSTYIPAESFAEAVMDLVVPEATKEITMATIKQDVDALPGEMTAFKPSLQALIKNAGDDIGVFRTSVERWFDHQMDHVSHEYKRRVAKITLVAGTVLVLLFNINALTIGRYLYSNEVPVDNAVSTVAAKSASCALANTQCLYILRQNLSAVIQPALPIGWSTVQDCIGRKDCNLLDKHAVFSRHGSSLVEALLFFIGFVLTILALLPGARFWFGLLSKLRDTLGV